MDWTLKFWYDYFFSFGLLVFLAALTSIIFFDGKVENVSTYWFVLPPVLFAWLRGEIYHWPKEKDQPNDQ